MKIDTFKQDFEITAPRQQYSVCNMLLWLNMILIAATGLRCASRAISVCLQCFNLEVTTPSWYTGRLWLMRLGYYKFNRPKQIADDWAWILDHSIQIGTEKCLLILGIRLSTAPKDRPLTYSDLEPIDLIPMRQSNGEIIYAQLMNTVAKTGTPRQIIADHGTDINAGINKFLITYSDTCSTYDIKHKTASILKKILGDDDQWSEFIKNCAATKKQLQQTELAFLAPPNQRAKARYMNVDILINWGMTRLQFFDNVMDKLNAYTASKLLKVDKVFEPTAMTDKPRKKHGEFINLKSTTVELNAANLKDKLGWIVKYREKLHELNRIMIIISTIESFIRKYGYTVNTVLKLQTELKHCVLCDKSGKVKDILMEFVKSESAAAKLDEVLLGSSEIIESLFGKQKTLSNEQSKSGFTGLIIGIGAFVATTTKEVIAAAMETVKTKDVIQWAEKTIGNTVQSLRNIVSSSNQNIEVKWN